MKMQICAKMNKRQEFLKNTRLPPSGELALMRNTEYKD